MPEEGGLKIIGPLETPEEKKRRGAGLEIIGPAPTPTVPAPTAQINIGTPEQQKDWYDSTEAYRKMVGQTTVMAAGGLSGVQAMPWLVRAGYMGILGMGANAWAQNVSRILTGEGPKTTKQAVSEMEEEGLFQAGAEVGGAVVGKVAGRLGATAVKAKELLDTAHAYSMPMAGPEVAGGGFGRTVQQIGERLLFGKSFASKMRDKFFAGLNVAADDTVATFGRQLTQEEAGTAFQDAFTIAKTKFREMSSSLYEGLIGRVEQTVGNKSIVDPTMRAFEEAKKIHQEFGQVTAKYPGLMKLPAEEAKVFDALYPGVREGVDVGKYKPQRLAPMTLREAQMLRSKLRDMAGNSDPTIRRLAARSEKVIDDSMKEALDQIPAGKDVTFKQELDGIDTAYREGKELFDGKAFSALVAKYPEEMAHSIKITDISKMRDVHKALVKYADDPETFDLFRKMWLQDKMRVPEMAVGEPGQVLAKGIANLSQDLRTKGRAITTEFFSDAKGAEVLHNLNRLAEVVKAKSNLSPVADSNLFVNWSTVHALMMGGLLATHHLPQALITASVPVGLVRVMYNKQATDVIVGAMSAAGKAGRIFSPGEIAQMTRAIRVALQGQEAVSQATTEKP